MVMTGAYQHGGIIGVSIKKRYEGTFVIDPELPEEEVRATVDEISKRISGGGGSVEESVSMGKRRLAYSIGGKYEGIYHRFDFTADRKLLEDLRKSLKLNQKIIRHLIVRSG